MTATPARRLGKYEILETLGAGAMGVVYLAYDPVIARRVAIKTISKNVLLAVADAAERFRREASAAGRLSHPGIVAVYDYGEQDDVAFIVMEYAPGLELGAYAAKHRPSFAQIGSLMGELLDALGYAHAAGVVHRDVKPGNILVAERLKITDFGVARINDAARSETGLAIGTPRYMSPEQLMGRGVDHRADLFGAAVILYELLTRRSPFDGDSLEELAYKICHAEPVPPSSIVADLPRGFDALLAQALAKSKQERFADAAEFASAIEKVLSGDGAERESSGLRQSVAHTAQVTSEGRVTSPGRATQWGPEILRALETILLPVIGSVARVAVRRSAARAATSTELLRLLSEAIAHERGYAALVERLRVVLAEPVVTGALPRMSSVSSTSAERIAVAPEAIERVARALAISVGPIAQVMTKKALANATSYLDLCMALSERLSTEAEKAAFLRAVGIR